jgi:uncharacterized protein with GYD domain
MIRIGTAGWLYRDWQDPYGFRSGTNSSRLFSGRSISMATYVILTRFSATAFNDLKDIGKLAEKVSSQIKSECPAVQWKYSFATLGRFDVIDIVESEDVKQVEKAAMLIRAYGRSTTETLPATPWTEFLALLR